MPQKTVYLNDEELQHVEQLKGGNISGAIRELVQADMATEEAVA